MKTSHAFSLVTLVFGGAVFSAASFVGCGSSDSTPAVTDTDTGTSEVATDTGPAKDTGTDTTKPPTDTPKLSCAADLPTDFACKTPTIPAGEKTCTETAIQEFASACFGSAAADCTAWTKKYAACNKCVTKFLSPSGYLEYGF